MSISSRIDSAICQLLERLSELAGTIGVGKRRVLASALEDEFFALETDLEVLRYEPARRRPAPEWLDARLEALHAIAPLKASLLLNAGTDDCTSSRHAARLQVLASRLTPSAAPSPAAPMSDAKPNITPFDAFVDGELDRVDRAIGPTFEIAGRDAFAWPTVSVCFGLAFFACCCGGCAASAVDAAPARSDNPGRPTLRGTTSCSPAGHTVHSRLATMCCQQTQHSQGYPHRPRASTQSMPTPCPSSST